MQDHPNNQRSRAPVGQVSSRISQVGWQQWWTNRLTVRSSLWMLALIGLAASGLALSSGSSATARPLLQAHLRSDHVPSTQVCAAVIHVANLDGPHPERVVEQALRLGAHARSSMLRKSALGQLADLQNPETRAFVNGSTGPVSSNAIKKALATPSTRDFIQRAADIPKLCATLHTGWAS